MNQLFRVMIGLFALCFVACGGGQNNYTIPADSPMKEFSPPDEEDLIEEEDAEEEEMAEEESVPVEPAPAVADEQ